MKFTKYRLVSKQLCLHVKHQSRLALVGNVIGSTKNKLKRRRVGTGNFLLGQARAR